MTLCTIPEDQIVLIPVYQSINLQAITDIRRIFRPVTSLACSLQSRIDICVVFRGSAFLVLADGVAGEVGVLLIETLSHTLFLLAGCLHMVSK